MNQMMSENEIRAYAWNSSISRVIAMIEEYSSPWTPMGPSKRTAEAIINKIRAMPIPHPTQAGREDDVG